MARRVREPIQVYLDTEERAELDRLAGQLGLSRSEVLRRGIALLGRRGVAPTLTEEDVLTPPLGATGAAPRGAPVAPLEELVRELREDRDSR